MRSTQQLIMQQLLVLVAVCSFVPVACAQSDVTIKLHNADIRCRENVIRLKHVAEIRTSDHRLRTRAGSLDLDSFDGNPRDNNVGQVIEISKTQIRYRLIIAGIRDSQIEISGPDKIKIVGIEPEISSQVVEQRIRSQLAQQYLMSVDDLRVTLDPRFGDLRESTFDFLTLKLEPTLDTEMPLGNQHLTAMVQDGSGSFVSKKLPVSIALMRDLVVAKQNISKGQTLNPENVESVRRPVASRNVRFVSFEQVVGKQAQNDVQQFELIKSNAIRTASTRTVFTIKKNSMVSVIVRKGALTVVLKDAKAMDNGNPGDRISLINQKTRERIIATVIDAATAEVRF